ncbi:MAG TPA: hypothetical protein VH044_10835 [Polyangiaceae bacterium]|jgi:hypothetical protein|nr:hypothetical protein [Polyangiaceae bacterium]
MRTDKPTRSDRNRKAIVGAQKHYAALTTVIIDGVPRTPASIVQALQGAIDGADATAAAAATFHKAVADEQQATLEGDAMYRGLKTLVMSQFKTSPETLADFGFTLPSRRVPDAATVATAVQKRDATRVARHTMGKRQKEQVKGTVTVPAPAPTGAPPTATSSPAAPANPTPPAGTMGAAVAGTTPRST